MVIIGCELISLSLSLLISPSEIVERVKDGRWPYLRPLLCAQSHSEELCQLMQRCWAEEPNDRPDFNQIKVMLRKHNRWTIHVK